tara:strand:- start:57 stop:272 length:216 start_codon:yes stop_codon:yes gene_type:complete
MSQQTLNLNKMMYDCKTGGPEDSGRTCGEWDLFDLLAHRNGHASGYSAARDHELWDLTVADAIDAIAYRTT